MNKEETRLAITKEQNKQFNKERQAVLKRDLLRWVVQGRDYSQKTYKEVLKEADKYYEWIVS